jgi:hypothetical protein
MLEKVDWFSFIVGGIVIAFVVNILSNFAQPRIEKWLAKYNSNLRDKNEKKKQAFKAEVQRLLASNHEELVARQNRSFLLLLMVLMNIFVMGFFIILIVNVRSVMETINLTGELICGILFLLLLERVQKNSRFLRAVDKEKGRPKI